MALKLAPTEHSVGQPFDRVDGRLKVTGGARYTAEWTLENLAYGALVTSTIASGKVTSIDTTAAERAPGVVAVITHRNAMRLRSQEQKVRPGVDPEVGTPLSPLQDDVVRYNGQPVAVVVADTFQHASQAARLVRVAYAHDRAVIDFGEAKTKSFLPSEARGSKRGENRSADYRRGDPDSAFAAAEVKVKQTYSTAANHHNAMEPHATTAGWEGEKLALYDKTQWVDNVAEQVAMAFDLKTADVRVLSPFVGGAFGAALRAWPHVLIAALAARQTRRPVKLVLTRAQVFVVPGYRPRTSQIVSLGATHDGKLTAILHDGTGQTSMYEEYTESLLDATRLFYSCPNVSTRYRLARMNVNTPASMRAPGEASGMYALESAMDELAVALKLDPIELRLRNHADVDPQTELPWSSKSLKECYAQGAQRFGWSRRNPEPRSMRDGKQLIGYGMASATWSTNRQPATVQVRLLADGTANVRTATSDIGPGTYTVMTQIAADALGLPFESVQFDLGDSRFPKAPVEGGSQTVASVGSAVHEAALAARSRACQLASRDSASPLYQVPVDEIVAERGELTAARNPSQRESYAALVKRHGDDAINVTLQSKPPDGPKKFTTRAFGAHFVEARVDADFGTVRVARVVSALAAGRIINPKTAGSQAIGGIVGGIGMALLEEGVRDARNARIVNDNLADYHMPVHADIPHIDAFYVEEHDPHVNPIGAKGLAEMSLCGVAAAVANAVFHATGKRVRDLPITPEKLL